MSDKLVETLSLHGGYFFIKTELLYRVCINNIKKTSFLGIKEVEFLKVLYNNCIFAA